MNLIDACEIAIEQLEINAEAADADDEPESAALYLEAADVLKTMLAKT